MENIVSFNGTILSNYQKTYPNLAKFTYDQANDALVYEGNFIKLNGYGLSRIDPVFFNMNPDEIFIFIKNGFYQPSNGNQLITKLLNKLVITEEEINFINNYVSQYIERLNIYASNRDMFDRYFENDNVKTFLQDIKFAKDIVEDAKNKTNLNDNSVYSFIVSAYNKEMSSMNQNKSQEQSMGKELTLTRNNPKISGYQLFDENENYLKKLNENQKMNIAGYTSIILIVATAITFGMYLAINFLP